MAGAGRHWARGRFGGLVVLCAALAAGTIAGGCGGTAADAAKEPRPSTTTERPADDGGARVTPTPNTVTGSGKKVRVVATKSEASFRRELDAACHEVKARFAEAHWNGGAINAQGSMGIAGLESIKTPPKLAEPFRRLLHDLLMRHQARSYGAGDQYPKLFAAYKRKYRKYSAKARADARGIGGLPACPWPMAPPGHSVFSP
jgi:hypothetical protein